MSSPIRVLELRSVRGTGGGPEKTILLSAAQADANEFLVTVCYIRDARDDEFHIDKRAAELGIDYVEVLERHSFDPQIIGKLRALVAAKRSDIVHSHDYKTDVVALVLARLERVIPLTTVHGWSGHSIRELYVYYPLHKFILRFFPRVIAVSPVIRQQLLAAGCSERRLRVILNGIDPAHFSKSVCDRGAARASFGVAAGEVCIGSVGRLEYGKRFDVLLRAFASFQARRPARLLIAGDGAERGPLMELARQLEIDNRVTLVGLQGDIRRFYSALDLFVQSSDSEGTPNVVLEAMAMEVPIVATDVGGTSALAPADTHALLVPRRDTDRLVEAMQHVVEHRDATAQRVTASRRRVENELSFQARMGAVEAVYRELVESRGRG